MLQGCRAVQKCSLDGTLNSRTFIGSALRVGAGACCRILFGPAAGARVGSGDGSGGGVGWQGVGSNGSGRDGCCR